MPAYEFLFLWENVQKLIDQEIKTAQDQQASNTSTSSIMSQAKSSYKGMKLPKK